MTQDEETHLARAAIQLLFVSGREFSLASLREKLRELFLREPEARLRAAASVGGFELLQVVLKASQRLEKLGLKLDVRAGAVRLTTAEVHSPALRDYLALLDEQNTAAAAPTPASEESPLGPAGLEVLACMALKGPLSQTEINGYFGADKRSLVHRLQHLGMVDCRHAPETGRTVWATTGEFLRRFGLQSPADLQRLHAESVPSGMGI